MPTNHLINETSPYLLQHAHNPVNWHAWNDESLEEAKTKDKMLLISIGYAACHWCHVMEQESFEDPEVAALMNEHFVCIKVDREERPDVDQIYMDAAMLVSGSGGWPLNALALQDGSPFFAGTYFPKKSWMELLRYFAQLYQGERKKIEEQAAHLSQGIRSAGLVRMPEIRDSLKDIIHPPTGHSLPEVILMHVDKELGGLTGNMKFAMPNVWNSLLEVPADKALPEDGETLIKKTLDKMALGGLFDQVGGGFSRYTTDKFWHVPHFEKMLYDNAQLVSLYSHAFQKWQTPLYEQVVRRSLAFIEREMMSPEGVFYSSLDADSDGEEGKFYVWEKEEIEKILGKDAAPYFNYFGITSSGNWEDGKNIPDHNYAQTLSAFNEKSAAETKAQQIEEWNAQLLDARSVRVRPATDDKILTSWNALMISGYCRAYRTFGDKEYLDSAMTATDFILENLSAEDGGLFRNYKNGKATIPAFLDDYAFMIEALFELYQVSFEEKYLHKAISLIQHCEKYFGDKEHALWYYTDQRFSERLIARKPEISDNVIPASNSQMAKNLFWAGQYFDNEYYRNQSVRMLETMAGEMQQHPVYHSNWLSALVWHLHPPFEVAVVGKEWQERLRHLQQRHLPHVLWMGGIENFILPLLEGKGKAGKTVIYVCRNKACKQPVEQIEEAVKQLQES